MKRKQNHASRFRRIELAEIRRVELVETTFHAALGKGAPNSKWYQYFTILGFSRSAWIAKSKPSADGFGNPSGAIGKNVNY